MGASGRLRKQINKQSAPPPGDGGASLSVQVGDPQQRQKADPNKIRQVDDLTAMFFKLIHGKETKASVMEALKSQPDPMKAIPMTANMLAQRIDEQAKKRRIRIPDDVKVASAQHVVVDLATLGNTARIWESPVTEEDLPAILEETMKLYIERGLRNKTIDPIKLQAEVEKLMTPEQRQKAMQLGQEGAAKLGMPAPPERLSSGQAVAHREGQIRQDEQQKLAKRQQVSALASEEQPQQQEVGING